MQSLIVAGAQLVAGVVLPPLPAPPVPTAVKASVPIVLVETVKRPNYEEDVLTPFREKRDAAQAKVKADCDAIEGTVDGDGFKCVPLPPPPAPEPPAPVIVPAAAVVAAPEPQFGGGHADTAPVATGTLGTALTGAFGYSLPGGNCVNEPGVNNPGWGNPIDWPVTSSQPWIGASALFTFNHVAVVTGLWSNGDIEVRQQNCPGCPTRYPRTAFRGFR